MSSIQFNGYHTAKIFPNIGELEGKHSSIHRQRGLCLLPGKGGGGCDQYCCCSI